MDRPQHPQIFRTVQLSIGAPETALISYATRGLADFYKLPCRTGGGLSDAKDFDMQAGIESDMMIRSTLEAAPDLVLHSCGIMGSFNILSFEKFLMDEDTYRMNRRLFKRNQHSRKLLMSRSDCQNRPSR